MEGYQSVVAEVGFTTAHVKFQDKETVEPKQLTATCVVKFTKV